ncbi:4-hydroxybenzoate octaprenyltransferase [Gammaproteobacteria bacterium]|nr:4-hydroxybenzoate octaprenyltransferase [Gammaproteobacteria bacterium]
MTSFHLKIKQHIYLLRWHKPIGFFLLGWPVVWVFIQLHDQVQLRTIINFLIGIILTRSLGCLINDLFDQNFDRQVKRCQNRPLAAGTLSKQETILPIALHLAGLCFIFYHLTIKTQLLALLAAGLMVLYPTSKRWCIFPQAILALAFSIAIPMAYIEVTGSIPIVGYWWIAFNFLWTILYDHLYAMADLIDDQKLPIHSSAKLIDPYHRHFLSIGYLLIAVILIMVGYLQLLPIWFYLIASAAWCWILRKTWLAETNQPKLCLQAFLANAWFGGWIALSLCTF